MKIKLFAATKEMNTPNAAYSAKMYAAKFICSKVVSSALTVSKNGIRQVSAMRWRNNEQARQVNTKTNAMMMPMLNPLTNVVATANAGNSPSRARLMLPGMLKTEGVCEDITKILSGK